MAQYSQFIMNHWPLFIALIAVLLLILFNETIAKKKQAKGITPQSAVKLLNEDAAIIFDMRDAENFRKGHIINAINLSSEDIDKPRIDKYKSKTVILLCANNLQPTVIATKLRQKGFQEPMVLTGGIAAWQNANLPLVR